MEKAIIMQYRMVFNALVEWIQGVIKDYGEIGELSMQGSGNKGNTLEP